MAKKCGCGGGECDACFPKIYRAVMRNRGNLVMARDWRSLRGAVADAKVMLTFSRPTHAIVEVEARQPDGCVRELTDAELKTLRAHAKEGA